MAEEGEVKKMGYAFDAKHVDKTKWKRWAGQIGTFGVSVIVADGFKCMTGEERGMIRESNKEGLKKCIAKSKLFSAYDKSGKELPLDDPARIYGIDKFVDDMDGLMVDSGHPTPQPPLYEGNYKE